MEPGTFPEVSVSSADLARMIYFFCGIADPDAIGKSVVSDNYSLVIRRRNNKALVLILVLDTSGPLISIRTAVAIYQLIYPANLQLCTKIE